MVKCRKCNTVLKPEKAVKDPRTGEKLCQVCAREELDVFVCSNCGYETDRQIQRKGESWKCPGCNRKNRLGDSRESLQEAGRRAGYDGTARDSGGGAYL